MLRSFSVLFCRKFQLCCQKNVASVLLAAFWKLRKPKQSTLLCSVQRRQNSRFFWKFPWINLGEYQHQYRHHGPARGRPGNFKHHFTDLEFLIMFGFLLQFLSRLTLMFDKARTKGHVQLTMKRCKFCRVNIKLVAVGIYVTTADAQAILILHNQ